MIINKGKIVADGTPHTLRKQAQGEEMLRIEIDTAQDRNLIIDSLQKIESVSMVDPVADAKNKFLLNTNNGLLSRKAIFQMCVQNNWVLTEMTPIETKLEDIFRELTT